MINKGIASIRMTRTIPVLMSLLFLSACQPVKNPSTPESRYSLAVDSTGNAWRLDTVTGEMRKCWQGQPPISTPTCIVATQP